MDASKFRKAPQDTMAEWEWTCGGGQRKRLLFEIWGWVRAETLVSGEGSHRKARDIQAKVPLCVWEESEVEHEPNCAEGLLAPGRGREAAPHKDSLSVLEGPSLCVCVWGGDLSRKPSTCPPLWGSRAAEPG